MPNSASKCRHIKGASEAAVLNGFWFCISIHLAAVGTGLHFMPLIPYIDVRLMAMEVFHWINNLVAIVVEKFYTLAGIC